MKFLKAVVNWLMDNPLNKGETKMARIDKNTSTRGGFELFDGSTPVGHYARRRDAVRGAKRRGLVIA